MSFLNGPGSKNTHASHAPIIHLGNNFVLDGVAWGQCSQTMQAQQVEETKTPGKPSVATQGDQRNHVQV
jgi:hypothetical protein